jgi:hypothetical protein
MDPHAVTGRVDPQIGERELVGKHGAICVTHEEEVRRQ